MRELFSDQTELNYLSLIFSAISQEEQLKNSNIFSQYLSSFFNHRSMLFPGFDVLNYQLW